MKNLKVVVSNDNGEELKFKAEILDNNKFKVKYSEFEFNENSEYDIETIIKWVKQMF